MNMEREFPMLFSKCVRMPFVPAFSKMGCKKPVVHLSEKGVIKAELPGTSQNYQLFQNPLLIPPRFPPADFHLRIVLEMAPAVRA